MIEKVDNKNRFETIVLHSESEFCNVLDETIEELYNKYLKNNRFMTLNEKTLVTF